MNQIRNKHKINNIKDKNEILVLKEKVFNYIRSKELLMEKRKKKINIYRENKLFITKKKLFYRKLQQDSDNNNMKIANKKEVNIFWSDIWKKKENIHNNKDILNFKIDTIELESIKIKEEETIKLIHNFGNWKTPGVDGIYNFFIKKLKILHPYLCK